MTAYYDTENNGLIEGRNERSLLVTDGIEGVRVGPMIRWRGSEAHFHRPLKTGILVVDLVTTRLQSLEHRQIHLRCKGKRSWNSRSKSGGIKPERITEARHQR